MCVIVCGDWRRSDFNVVARMHPFVSQSRTGLIYSVDSNAVVAGCDAFIRLSL